MARVKKVIEPIDYSSFSHEEIKKAVYNQIMSQALKDMPQASILLFAAKLVNVESNESSSEFEKLSTEELINKVKSIII